MAVTTPTATSRSFTTADELFRLPNDGFRYELIRGELKKMPPAGYEHGTLAMRFGSRLLLFVEDHNLGSVTAAETGFVLSTNPDTVRAPDAAFVRKELIERIGLIKGYWPGPPDLAVEVLSPNDTYSEVEEKALEWLRAGCRCVLVINPRRRTVTVYHSAHHIESLEEEETLNLDPVVPGFSIKVKAIFG